MYQTAAVEPSVRSVSLHRRTLTSVRVCWDTGDREHCPDPNTTHLCQVVKRLPKTRSGKVMRRLLRKIITSKGQDLGDTTTLEDPSVITEILSAFQKYEDQRAAAKWGVPVFMLTQGRARPLAVLRKRNLEGGLFHLSTWSICDPSTVLCGAQRAAFGGGGLCPTSGFHNGVITSSEPAQAGQKTVHHLALKLSRFLQMCLDTKCRCFIFCTFLFGENNRSLKCNMNVNI